MLGAWRYRIMGSRSRAPARRRMDSPSMPSRSMSASAVASTRSRVSLVSPLAAGMVRLVGDVVIAAAPCLLWSRPRVTSLEINM